MAVCQCSRVTEPQTIGPRQRALLLCNELESLQDWLLAPIDTHISGIRAAADEPRQTHQLDSSGVTSCHLEESADRNESFSPRPTQSVLKRNQSNQQPQKGSKANQHQPSPTSSDPFEADRIITALKRRQGNLQESLKNGLKQLAEDAGQILPLLRRVERSSDADTMLALFASLELLYQFEDRLKRASITINVFAETFGKDSNLVSKAIRFARRVKDLDKEVPGLGLLCGFIRRQLLGVRTADLGELIDCCKQQDEFKSLGKYGTVKDWHSQCLTINASRERPSKRRCVDDLSQKHLNVQDQSGVSSVEATRLSPIVQGCAHDEITNGDLQMPESEETLGGFRGLALPVRDQTFTVPISTSDFWNPALDPVQHLDPALTTGFWDPALDPVQGLDLASTNEFWDSTLDPVRGLDLASTTGIWDPALNQMEIPATSGPGVQLITQNPARNLAGQHPVSSPEPSIVHSRCLQRPQEVCGPSLMMC